MRGIQSRFGQTWGAGHVTLPIHANFDLGGMLVKQPHGLDLLDHAIYVRKS